jgi:hypothetical protein
MPDQVPIDAAFLEDRSLETSATPSTWKPTAEEESYIFKLFRGFSLSERSSDRVWEYGFDIQSTTERKWACMPCIRGKEARPAPYEHEGTKMQKCTSGSLTAVSKEGWEAPVCLSTRLLEAQAQ